MIYKNKAFTRFARQQRISDFALCEAVERAERGLVDADLGGGVIKQRIARPGAGRSGGFRSIVLFRTTERAFFVYGFAKNERENIRDDELTAFRLLADELLAYTQEQLQIAQEAGILIEVVCPRPAEMENLA
jgi:hypothetical protein